jgi:hypothetical protein
MRCFEEHEWAFEGVRRYSPRNRAGVLGLRDIHI